MPLDRAPRILTDELDARVERLLTDWRTTARATGGAAQDFVRMARELGVGIVDINRDKAWVDERVHHGVLLRLRDAEARADQAERDVKELQGLMGGEGR